MTTPAPGAIDCDIHPALPSMQVLRALLGRVLARPRHHARAGAGQLHRQRLSAERADQRPARLEAAKGNAGTDLRHVAKRKRWMHSAPATPSATFCMAPRRSSARTCPPPSAARSTIGSRASGWTRTTACAPPSSCRCTARSSPREEIERVAADPRFVQVLVWEMSELPLGRRIHWPLYRVAEQLDLPIGIHAGSSYRHPPTNLGWPSYYLEDYVSWSHRICRRAE